MDAVCRDHKPSVDDRAIGERHSRRMVVLLEADATVSGMHHIGGQGLRQYLHEIGAMHTERRVPACRIRHLNRRDRRPVLPKVPGSSTNPGSQPLYRRPQPNPLKLADTVWGQKHAGADFTEARGLLIDRHLNAVRDQRIGGEQSADPASNYNNVRPRPCHNLIPGATRRLPATAKEAGASSTVQVLIKTPNGLPPARNSGG